MSIRTANSSRAAFSIIDDGEWGHELMYASSKALYADANTIPRTLELLLILPSVLIPPAYKQIYAGISYKEPDRDLPQYWERVLRLVGSFAKNLHVPSKTLEAWRSMADQYDFAARLVVQDNFLGVVVLGMLNTPMDIIQQFAQSTPKAHEDLHTFTQRIHQSTISHVHITQKVGCPATSREPALR